MIDKISVFFPAFNEAKNLELVVSLAVTVLEKDFEDWEIIIVNDGSTDETHETALKLAAQNSRITLVEHEINRGYGASLRSGIGACRFGWIAFTDADGQFDFSEIRNFITKQNETGVDLVLGYYRRRRVPFYRKVNTFLWEFLVNLLFGLAVKDIDCGFKLFSRRVVGTIAPLESERGAFISTEFLVKAKKAGFAMAEVAVTHYPRQKGSGTGADLNVIFQSFRDLMRLWRKLK